MKTVIKSGTQNQNIATCKHCKCEFTYEASDILGHPYPYMWDWHKVGDKISIFTFCPECRKEVNLGFAIYKGKK